MSSKKTAPLARWRSSAITAGVAALAVGALLPQSAAHADEAPQKTVAWVVTSGDFANRFATPQTLFGGTIGACGQPALQVDTYRYDTPEAVATVDALIAGGVLASAAEDSSVYLSNVDMPATAPCEVVPVSVKTITPTVHVVCSPTGGGYQYVTAATQEHVSYLVDDEAGMNHIVVTATADDGYVLTGQTQWDFSKLITDEEKVCPAPAAADLGKTPAAPAGPGATDSGTPAVAAAASPTVAHPVAAAAEPTLAMTGTRDLRPILPWIGLAIAAGIALKILDRRKAARS